MAFHRGPTSLGTALQFWKGGVDTHFSHTWLRVPLPDVAVRCWPSCKQSLGTRFGQLQCYDQRMRERQAARQGLEVPRGHAAAKPGTRHDHLQLSDQKVFVNGGSLPLPEDPCEAVYRSPLQLVRTKGRGGITAFTLALIPISYLALVHS